MFDNYVFPFRIIKYDINTSNPLYYEYHRTFSDTEVANAQGIKQHAANVNGSTAAIPGLKTFIKYCKVPPERNPEPRNPTWDMGYRSAGVDCSGFICTSANYGNNPYKLPSRTDSWKFVENKDYSWDFSDEELNMLVPGDILVHPDTPEHEEGHVVIVRSIRYTTGRTVIDYSREVLVIEATSGTQNQWRVMNSQTWYSIHPFVYKLIIKRRYE